jgi:four helix bundle protein
MGFMFERLEVYQRAIDLAEKITRLTEAFPPKQHHRLVDQLRRASMSISLNIAEGNGPGDVSTRCGSCQACLS